MRLLALPLVLSALLATAACSSGGSQSAQPTENVTTAPQGNPVTSSTTSTTTTIEEATPESTPSATDGKVILQEKDRGVELSINKFFRPDTSQWGTLPVHVGGVAVPAGIGAEVGHCLSNGDSTDPSVLRSSRVLELRTEGQFKVLSFKAGQSNKSETSDAMLRVSVFTDSSAPSVKIIKYGEVKEFSYPIDGAFAMKIALTLAPKSNNSCGYDSVNGVVWDVKVA